jgi:hypothetical protein
VKSIACSAINGKPKLIEAKLDNFEKHEGKRVAVLDNVKRGLKKNDVYHDKECSHLRNVSLFAARRPESILKLVNGAVAGENRRKGVQYSTLFSVLQYGRTMSNYSSSRFLLEHLKINHLPTKHWYKSSGWEMAHYMHLSVLAALTRKGCLNGHPTVKFTIRTSFSSECSRASEFTPRTDFTVRAGKNPSARTLGCVHANATHRPRGRTHSLPSPLPCPPLPPPLQTLKKIN